MSSARIHIAPPIVLRKPSTKRAATKSSAGPAFKSPARASWDHLPSIEQPPPVKTNAFELESPMGAKKDLGGAVPEVGATNDIRGAVPEGTGSDGIPSLQKKKSVRTSPPSGVLQVRIDTVRRMVHSVWILGALFYIRMSTLSLQTLDCVAMPDGSAILTKDGVAPSAESHLYLVVDPTTQCYTGTHALAAALAVFILVFFSLMYPFYAFLLLTRTFARASTPGIIGALARSFKCLQGKSFESKKSAVMVTRKRIEMLGYLFRGLRPEVFYYRVMLFPLQFLYASMSVFSQDVNLSIFVLGAGSALQTLAIVIYLPFRSWIFNLTGTAAALATVAHAIFLLGLQNGHAISFLAPLCAIFGAVSITLLFRKSLMGCCSICKVALHDTEEDEPAHEDDADENLPAEECDEDGEQDHRQESASEVDENERSEGHAASPPHSSRVAITAAQIAAPQALGEEPEEEKQKSPIVMIEGDADDVEPGAIIQLTQPSEISPISSVGIQPITAVPAERRKY